MSSHKSKNSNIVRDEVRCVATEAITLMEFLYDTVAALETEPRSTAWKAHCLTIYAFALIREHYEGAYELHLRDMPHAASVLERCIFETLVQLRVWHDDEAQAVDDWRMLPIVVYNEQIRRVGGDKSKLPPQLQSDRDQYLAANPDLPEETPRRRFKEEARAVLLRAEWDEQTFRNAFFKFYDVPSLFTHARAHGAEDFYRVNDAGEWELGRQHRYTEPNAQILAATGLVLQTARDVAKHYRLSMQPIDRLAALWDESLAAQPGRP